jgi:hypothetical protein
MDSENSSNHHDDNDRHNGCDHTASKKKLIAELLLDVSKKKKLYHKKLLKLKRIEDISEAIIIASGTIAVSNILITIASINPITLIIGATFSSISTIGSAIKRVFELKAKGESCKTSFIQFSELERETKAMLAKNHMTSFEYSVLISDINHRISLIEDTAVPVSSTPRSNRSD